MSKQTVQFDLASVDCMAEILAETVAEISDPIAARQALAFAGFSDERDLQSICAKRNTSPANCAVPEIDRLYASQFRTNPLRHG